MLSGDRPTFTRRDALRRIASDVAALCAVPTLLGCASSTAELPSEEGLGRLRARYAPATETLTPGEHPLGLRPSRDGVLYLPPQYRPDQPIPLVLVLHGAGGSGQRIAQRFHSFADDLGIAFVAPDSADVTWDGRDRLVTDVQFIDRALTTAYRRINARPGSLAVAGFSDGASYALAIGLTNGDVLPRILAMSPGFCNPAQVHGKPELYFTHGTRDEILPIDQCSRSIVPTLRGAGYSVQYQEFDGGHETPAAICRPAFEWLIRA
jgi:phospholipase/carboxylesterase